MKVACLFLLLTLTILDGIAQETSYYTGLIKDSVTKKAIDGATISISFDQKKPMHVIADDNGRFILKNLQKGTYHTVISTVGYVTKEIDVELRENKEEFLFLMERHFERLGDVVIHARRNLITQKTDRIVYDVYNDPDKNALSGIEIMRKVPLLSVDADDQIKLKGQSNLRILINGKASSIVDQKPSDYLKVLSASKIREIEVITIPPSKYESEGLTGIVNIITDTKTIEGIEGTISAFSNIFSDQISRSGMGTVDLKIGKLGVSAYGGTAVEKPKQNIFLEQKSLESNGPKLEQNQNDIFKTPYTYGAIEMNYKIDTLNLFTADFNFYNGGNTIEGQAKTSFERSGNSQSSFENMRKSLENYQTLSFSLNYEKGFKRSKKDFLTLSYRYNNYSDKLVDSIAFYNQNNVNRTNFNQINDQRALEHTIQSDYVVSIEQVLIDFGFKAILRRNQSKYQDLVSETTFNHFDNTQNVFSFYNSNSFKLGNWSIKVGARMENTVVHANYNGANKPVDFNTFNVSPSLALSKPLKENVTLSLGYTQRLSRPKISDVNTFVDQSNPYIQTTGNFALRPSVGHNFQASYSNFSANNFMLSMSCSIEKNMIQKVSIFDNETGISYSRFENLGRNESIGLNAYYKTAITKNIAVDFNGNINQVWISGIVQNKSIKNDRLNMFLSTSPSISFKNNFRLLSNFTYELPTITLQQLSNHYISFYLGLSKSFSNNNLNISLFAYNPIQRYRQILRDLNGNNFVQNSDIELYNRKFTLKVSYKFGKLTGRIGKVKTRINNDDLK